MWLEHEDDVRTIAEAIGKPAEEIKSLLKRNTFDDKRSVFHLGTGEQRDLSKKSCDSYPRHHLERLFMEDLYKKAEIVWTKTSGSIVQTEEHIVFNIRATVDGKEYHQRFAAVLGEMDDEPDISYNKKCGNILDHMVELLDLEVKVFRYGPMF